jgi:CRISPR-associated protein Csd1
MYLKKRIRWLIDLRTGRPPAITPLSGTGTAAARGAEMLVPNVKRASGVRPILLADKPSYVLGIRVPDPKADLGRDPAKDEERTLTEHRAFKELVGECAAVSSDAAVVAAFLDGWSKEQPSFKLPPDMERSDLITFAVNGRLVVEDGAVRAFWASHGRDAAEEDAGGRMQCLVSGAWGEVEEMMPVPVKGLAGGKSEMAIISANSSAFESYHLDRARTSPVCRDAGERFGQALNALLASPDHHARIQTATYVYWSPGGKAAPIVFEPDPQEVRRFLSAVHAGQSYYATAGSAPFYLFGLVPNAARVAVRSALETTVGEIERRQVEWFARLNMIGFDEAGRAVVDRAWPIKTLAVAGYREFKEIAPGVEDALVRCALNGEPAPAWLLKQLVNRCRAERRVTHVRAALTKFILTQEFSLLEASAMTNEVSTKQVAGLGPDEAQAYHLGRLFAELEEVQRAAIPGINAGIADRFYGSASSMPASVFGMLLDGAQNHLAKLRKEREGAYSGSQKRIEEISVCIDRFPPTLTLKSQAHFSLGYYHHRAARRRTVTEAAAAKRAARAAQEPLDIDDPALAPGDEND